MWDQILFLMLAAFMIWLLYISIRGKRDLFTRSNFAKTAWTLGWLALFLIGFIALLVIIVRK